MIIAKAMAALVAGSLAVGGSSVYFDFIDYAKETVAKANTSEVARFIYTYNELGISIDRLMYEIGAEPVDGPAKSWVYKSARFEWDSEHNVLRSIVGEHCFEADVGEQVRPDVRRCLTAFEPQGPAVEYLDQNVLGEP